MDLNLTPEGLARVLAEALRSQVQHEGDVFSAEVPIHVIGGPDEVETLTESRARMEGLIESIEALEVSDETTLYGKRTYEVLVREESPVPGSWLQRSRAFPIRVSDPDLEIEYELGWASDEYLVLALRTLETLAAVRDFWRFPLRRSHSQRQLDLLEDEADAKSDGMVEALRHAPPRLMTLRIRTGRDRTLPQLQTYADAFLFQLSFNVDISLIPLRSFEELARRSRIRRIRRANLEEVDPPRRAYTSALIQHYQMGVATDNAALEFLSYYHVAESFFDSVFHDDLIDSIRDRLTRPDFSFRRKTDVQGLITHISKRLRFRQEEVVFSEEEALRLTLSKYLQPSELVESLEAVDPGLIEYYRDTEIGFAQGDRVDLRSDDIDGMLRFLARRIYKARNAVVHSKEGTKPKYVPFKHDPDLLREVPLVRLIAEQIILRSARELT